MAYKSDSFRGLQTVGSTGRAVLSGNEFGWPRRAFVVEQTVAPIRWEQIVLDGVDCDDAQAVAWVREQLLDMGRTLLRAPKPKELQNLVAAVSGWPAILHDASEQGAWETHVRPVLPGKEEIDRMDDVLGWMLWLAPDVRCVVFAQSLGFSFEKVKKLDTRRRSTSTIKRVFNVGVMEIVSRLRKKVLD